MCGIVGFINYTNPKRAAKASLKKINYRGTDDEGFYSTDNICLAHCLHSVVGELKQPLINERFVLGANCEIYNWKALAIKHNLKAHNDAELLLALFTKKLKAFTEKNINEIIIQLDGVYAFFLYDKKSKTLMLARDILGVKPLWFSEEKNKFAFASEKKALGDAEELNPRKILIFKNKIKFLNRPFFTSSEKDLNIEKATNIVKDLLIKAVKKRVPKRKLGLLFSGGLDSTVLAFLLKTLKVPFKCYMTVCGNKNDAEQAMKIAKELKLDLKVIKISEDKLKKSLPEVINLIESADPVKVEVATTLFFSLKEAKKDNIKVIFSGVGADDIFGGYKRMLAAKEVNLDSISNLRRMYERDLYRDDVISMFNNIELRLPFLDKELVTEVLKIPSKYKLGEETKPILRDIARQLGLKQSGMKRKAAQYGSGIAKAISKFAQPKGKYLASLTKIQPLKLGVLFSSGKDSTYALHIQKRLNYNIACLITVQSTNEDSYMFHTPNISLAKYQAKAMELPLILQKTTGEKEKELLDLKKAIKKAKDKYKIQGIVTGALFSNYQRSRIEKICDELNLKVFSPLWHMSQEVEMRNLVREGYKIIMVKIAGEGLNKSWLNKIITKTDIDKLAQLNKKIGFNIAGEGGEFESFVLEAPMFKHPLEIKKSHIIEESENVATLVIDKVRSKT